MEPPEMGEWVEQPYTEITWKQIQSLQREMLSCC